MYRQVQHTGGGKKGGVSLLSIYIEILKLQISGIMYKAKSDLKSL